MLIVQIAGTNGKGSVACYIASILQAAGRCTGLFTSPHLISPRERIRVNGEKIPQEDLDRLMAEQPGDNLFARYTGACMEWFRQNHVEIAVMETGLGGRLDPVTALGPTIAVLTSIGLDHTELLGDTIEKITLEKCCVIPHKGAVVTLPQRPEAMRIIEATAEHCEATLLKTLPQDLEGEGDGFSFQGLSHLKIQAAGSSQPLDAAAAILTIRAISYFAPPIPEEAIRKGLADTVIPARAQHFAELGLVVDGAHNPDAFLELSRTLRARFPEKEIVLLTAAMKKKDILPLAQMAKENGWKTFCTTLPGDAFESPRQLARLFSGTAVSTVEKAFKKAHSYAQKQNALLVVAGSFYLAGAVLELTGHTC